MNKGLLFLLVFILLTTSCERSNESANQVEVQALEEWAKKSSIYEVNIRQYTPEGTFNAFIPHLKNIRELGSDILWLMPVHPIGKVQRKGKLGSYYAVMDYTAINPNFGSKQDFKSLVDSAHSLGFKVILDWVANHTAWDHHWVKDHPEYYTRDSSGKSPIVPEGTDWTDVADLNYDNQQLQAEMIDAMQYWVREFNIDGYRCDVAGFVPMEFWKRAVDSINEIKKVFMLAEWDEPEMHQVFHMTYAWGFHHLLKKIANGDDPKSLLKEYYKKENEQYPDSAFRMYFITNHDENSWKQSVFERYGEDLELLAILTFTFDGMPLVYSGQEAGLNKALRFFDKDTIDWKENKWRPFYKSLLDLHETTPALWNGVHGARAEWLATPPDVVGYKRIKESQGIYVYLNFSNERTNISLGKQKLKIYQSSAGAKIENGELLLPAKGFYIGETEKN